jgi:hypothetical protein
MRAPRSAAPLRAADPGPPFGWWRVQLARMSPLARDITVVLIVKALVLTLLWLVFFRAPAAPQMNMDPHRVVERVAVASSAAVTSSAPEALRAVR